ncbi:MAG: Ig-like domain-containing protein [Planctomycetota bacterium]
MTMRRVIAACLFTVGAGCGGGGGGGSGQSGPAELQDLAGVGGGIVIANVFPGALIERTAPVAVQIAPAATQSGIAVDTVVAVRFSESMNVAKADPGRNLRLLSPQGKDVDANLLWSHQQQFAVLEPKSPLRAGTYTVAIDGSVKDLTGHAFVAADGSSLLQAPFTVAASAAALAVIAVAPQNGEANVYRGTTVALVFSEPVQTGTGAGSIEHPGNLRVRLSGQSVAGKLEVRAHGRLVEFTPDDALPKGTSVAVEVSAAVLAASGRALAGGFESQFTTIGFSSTDELSFPGNTKVTQPFAADGVIANRSHSPKLHAFDVHLEAPGVNTVGVWFVDPTLHGGNGFRFEHAGAQGDLAPDLEPQTTPALNEGLVKVGSYAIKNGVTGPIDVVKTLLKDTRLFDIVELGPPHGDESMFPDTQRLLAIYTRDSAIVGTLDSPSGPFQFVTSGDTGFAGPSSGGATATYRAIRNLGGADALPDQTSFEDGEGGTPNVFISGPPDVSLGSSYDPVGLDLKKGQDAFGNVSGKQDLVHVAVVQVGVVGGSTTRCQDDVPENDPDYCLYVSVTDANTLIPIAVETTGAADVVLERFPPNGMQLAPRSSPATFGREDFTNLGNPDRVTITIVKDGYHLVSYAGVLNPIVAQRPLGIHALLEPAHGGVAIPVEVRDQPGSGLQVELGGNELLLSDADKRLTVPGSPADFTSLDWHAQHVKALVGIGTRSDGTFQVAADVPHIRDGGLLVLDFTKARVFDAQSAVTIKIFSHKSDTDDSRVYSSPNINIDLAEVRLLAMLPGFTGVLPMFVDTKLSKTGGADDESVGEVLLPSYFLQNDGNKPKNDDSPIELIIQPSLAGAGAAVSSDALRRVFHTEYVLRNQDDGRLTLQRSPIDFSILTAPRAVFENADLPRIPLVTTQGSIPQPPLVQWTSEIAKEGLYVAHLIKPGALDGLDRRWDVYLAADAALASEIQYPKLDPALGYENNVTDFATAGTYGFVLDAFGFDVDDPNDATDDALVQFQFDGFLTGETVQRLATWTRTENTVQITTQDP